MTDQATDLAVRGLPELLALLLPATASAQIIRQSMELDAHGQLIERFVALGPPPRANLVRCHGVLAPKHRLHAAAVPCPTGTDEFGHRPGHRVASPTRVPWTQLVRGTFELDVLRCARCGARRRVLWRAPARKHRRRRCRNHRRHPKRRRRAPLNKAR